MLTPLPKQQRLSEVQIFWCNHVSVGLENMSNIKLNIPSLSKKAGKQWATSHLSMFSKDWFSQNISLRASRSQHPMMVRGQCRFCHQKGEYHLHLSRSGKREWWILQRKEPLNQEFSWIKDMSGISKKRKPWQKVLFLLEVEPCKKTLCNTWKCNNKAHWTRARGRICQMVHC